VIAYLQPWIRKKPREGLPALHCVPFLQPAMMNGREVVGGEWDGYGLRFEDMANVDVPYVYTRGYNLRDLLRSSCF